MIVIKDVSKKFDDNQVLKGLNWTIKDNCIYGLIGTNGAGKSTLLRIMNDIYGMDQGEVLIDNQKIKNNPKLKEMMAFVPDDLYFFPGYTLKDMFHFYKGMYPTFDMEEALKLSTNLKLDVNKKISTFSKGMKRQCALICAIATNVKYLFLDETFDGIDPIIRMAIKKILMEKMDQNQMTIIMTSHNLRELEDICEHMGVLFQGEILFESDLESVKMTMKKVQISLKEDFNQDTFAKLCVINFKKQGSVATLIIKDENNNAREILEAMNPVLLDMFPLTLEEVFLYEMEVLGYEFGQICKG